MTTSRKDGHMKIKNKLKNQILFRINKEINKIKKNKT